MREIWGDILAQKSLETITRTCNVRFWSTKKTLGESWGHRNELRTLVNNEESILTHSLLQMHHLHVEDVNNLGNSVLVLGEEDVLGWGDGGSLCYLLNVSVNLKPSPKSSLLIKPKCQSIDEQIKKMWYTYTTEYSWVIKRNKTGSFIETWMDLESTIHSQVSQKDKNKYCTLTHICQI